MNLFGSGAKLGRAVRRIRKTCVQRIRPRETATPVFIVGAHRCGTSMTLQAFDEGDYSIAYEQSDKHAFHDHMLCDDRTIQSLIDRCRADVAAFKPLRQNQQITRYLTAFPTLRVVWLVRDFHAAAASAAAQWNSIHRSFAHFFAGNGTADWRFEGMTSPQRRVLKSHYSPKLSLTSAYALFWYLRSSIYFEHRLDEEERVHLFFYEDLVERPKQEFRRMMDFCRCRFDDKVYRHVQPQKSRKLCDDIDGSIAELCQQLFERLMLNKDGLREHVAPPAEQGAVLGEMPSHNQVQSFRE